MGSLPSRILPLLTQSLLVATISPRLDQGVECPASGDDEDDGDDANNDTGVDESKEIRFKVNQMMITKSNFFTSFLQKHILTCTASTIHCSRLD